MENTEVINVEEIKTVEPVIEEVAEAVNDHKIEAIGGFVAGVIVTSGVVALWKFVIKPGVKKAKAKIEEKKCARALHDVGLDDESTVTTVDFEEVQDDE